MPDTCTLCRGTEWSGYARPDGDGGFEYLPCRCVIDLHTKQIYGHPRHKMEMLRALAALRA